MHQGGRRDPSNISPARAMGPKSTTDVGPES
jgi:hypothetical protein